MLQQEIAAGAAEGSAEGWAAAAAAAAAGGDKPTYRFGQSSKRRYLNHFVLDPGIHSTH